MADRLSALSVICMYRRRCRIWHEGYCSQKTKQENAVLFRMNFRCKAAFFMSGGSGVNILHELWYGNIYPGERPIMKDGEYAQALHKAADEKDG